MPILEALIYSTLAGQVLIRITVNTHNMDTFVNTVFRLRKPQEKQIIKLSENSQLSILHQGNISFACLHTADVSLQLVFYLLERLKTEFWELFEENYQRTESAQEFDRCYDEIEHMVQECNQRVSTAGFYMQNAGLEYVTDIKILKFEEIEEQNRKNKASKSSKKESTAVENEYKYRKETEPSAFYNQRQTRELLIPKQRVTKKPNRNKKAVCMVLVAFSVLGFLLVLNICGGYSFHEC